MKVTVEIFASLESFENDGSDYIHKYTFDYNNPQNRKVFAEQSRRALGMGQVVITYVEK